jgi:hypothetical protein
MVKASPASDGRQRPAMQNHGSPASVNRHLSLRLSARGSAGVVNS